MDKFTSLLFEFNCHSKRKLNDDLVISYAKVNVRDESKANNFQVSISFINK